MTGNPTKGALIKRWDILQQSPSFKVEEGLPGNVVFSSVLPSCGCSRRYEYKMKSLYFPP
jgi:hypothetical protein